MKVKETTGLLYDWWLAQRNSRLHCMEIAATLRQVRIETALLWTMIACALVFAMSALFASLQHYAPKAPYADSFMPSTVWSVLLLSMAAVFIIRRIMAKAIKINPLDHMLAEDLRLALKQLYKLVGKRMLNDPRKYGQSTVLANERAANWRSATADGLMATLHGTNAAHVLKARTSGLAYQLMVNLRMAALKIERVEKEGKSYPAVRPMGPNPYVVSVAEPLRAKMDALIEAMKKFGLLPPSATRGMFFQERGPGGIWEGEHFVVMPENV